MQLSRECKKLVSCYMRLAPLISWVVQFSISKQPFKIMHWVYGTNLLLCAQARIPLVLDSDHESSLNPRPGVGIPWSALSEDMSAPCNDTLSFLQRIPASRGLSTLLRNCPEHCLPCTWMFYSITPACDFQTSEAGNFYDLDWTRGFGNNLWTKSKYPEA